MILSRYVLRIVLKQVLAVCAVLFLLVVVLQFTRVLARAAAEQFPTDLLWSIIAWGAAQNVSAILPMSVSLGIVLALGRLHEDHEIGAMEACGAGGAWLFAPIVALVVVSALVLAVFSLLYNPHAAAQTDFRKGEALLRSSFLNPRPGEFRSFDDGSLVLRAERVSESGDLEDVFAYRREGADEVVAVARAGRIERTPQGLPSALLLQQGTVYLRAGRTLRQRIVRFEEQRIGLRIPMPSLGPTRTDARSTASLWRSADAKDVAELQGRLAQPCMALVLGCLSVRLSRLKPRESRYSHAALLVLIFFGYSSLLTAGESWIAAGQTPAWLGLWWLHGSVIVAALLVYSGRSSIGRWRAARGATR